MFVCGKASHTVVPGPYPAASTTWAHVMTVSVPTTKPAPAAPPSASRIWATVWETSEETLLALSVNVYPHHMCLATTVR
ncbi:hypothetical protein GCM10010357_62430 [Streptomyces luteireticuli]|uniref:Uncharacterized protein n=1 Tax=Streptomyces luteireticuli TaxID=173858 RepID=A0ABP3J041_9ACTN